jgi:hypothetical protein
MGKPIGERQNGRAIAPGDRVQLIGEPPDFAAYAIKAGARGTVTMIDSQHTIHIRWDNGAQLGIIAELAGLLRIAAAPGDGT